MKSYKLGKQASVNVGKFAEGGRMGEFSAAPGTYDPRKKDARLEQPEPPIGDIGPERKAFTEAAAKARKK